MTLPTTPPFDYPDWGQPGTVTASFSNIAVVAATGDVLWEGEVGYYNHTLLHFDGNGDGASYSVQIQWLTAAPSEGGTVVIEQTTTVIDGCRVVLPMTNPSTYLRIRDNGATAYPHNALLLVTQFAAYGNMVGYAGGPIVGMFTGTVDAAETLTRNMEGCAPGRHAVQLVTDSAAWDLYLRNWYDYGTPFDVLLADETTAEPYSIEWIAPGSSWQLEFTNNDATTCDLSLIVTRLPA